jgi:ribosomal-protein-alanine N-acetyltransferase
MTEDDIEQVVSIEKSIFSMPWSGKSFLDACTAPENIYLVCEDNNIIQGYCGLWTVIDEGNITNMAVAPDYRRMGIARELMKEMEKRGREKNVSVFFLEVRESNLPARGLYEEMDYRTIGRRKNFYEKPVEDALIMSKIYRE